MSASKHRSLDWTRCAEGFQDFNTDGESLTKRRAEPLKRKSVDSGFSHGNIFEKLAFGNEEEKSQSINWSSSEDEKEKEVQPVPVVKKPKRQTTPRNAPARRSIRGNNRLQSTSLSEDHLEILDLDGDKDHWRTNKSKDETPVKKPEKKPLLDDAVEIIDLEKMPDINLKDSTFKKRSWKKSIPDDKAVVIDLEGDSDIVPTSQPTQDGSSVKSEDVIGIQIYDSDQEAQDEGKLSEDKKTEEASQASITVDDSQNATSPGTQAGTGLKASDWVKSLQLKTPNKAKNEGEKLEPEDSAKKRKKHSKGGLAAQLERLQSRDKSSVRMWYHQQGKPSASQDAKSLQLEVIGYENLYSMQLTKCIICEDELSSESESTLQDVADTAEDHQKMGDSSCLKNFEKTRLVMFPASQSEQLNLQKGSRFKIFPPWQQLELNDGQQILLCTKYCHVINHPEIVPQALPSTEMWLKDVVTAKWNCPCVQGLCRSQTLCPAYQFPAVPGYNQDSEGTSTQGKDSNSNLLKSSERPVTSHLHTVSSKPCDKFTSGLGRSLNETSICDSLLKSIEACKTAVDGGGDGYSGTVSFSGHVHRAVTVRNGTSKTRCHLLVEDKYGNMCEIQLLTKSLTKAGFTKCTCENKTFKFSGLSVHDRFIRDKHEALFTMIDHVWSGKCHVESQESAESQNILGRMAEPPGFCYTLQETDSSLFSIEQCPSNILPCKTPEYMQLSETWKSEAMRRISCLVKVLYIHTKDKSHVLYVTDSSLKKLQSYSMIQVSSACDFPNKLSTFSERTTLILRDLFLCQGELHADQYTGIELSSDMLQIDSTLSREISRLQQVAIEITVIHKGVTDNDLCIVKGQITEVDEDSAYSWEVCVHCESDQLQVDSSQGSKCLACKKSMDEPLTKMKMEVMITCEISNIQAKVDLLQRTIENLLPTDEVDEEGYELSSVLSRKIGPLKCVVLSSSGDTLLLKEIDMLK